LHSQRSFEVGLIGRFPLENVVEFDQTRDNAEMKWSCWMPMGTQHTTTGYIAPY
jgi:hypothetical protein